MEQQQATPNTTATSTTTTTTPASTAPQSAPSPVTPVPKDASISDKVKAVNEQVEKAASSELESAPSEYSPNWKFNVADKEHEVEEWARGFIKDPDTEKKFKDLYTKAFGLEPVKASREKLQQEHTQLKEVYTKLYTDVSEAMQYKNSGNLDFFFKAVGLTDEQVAKYMLDKINRNNLPPEQQQVYNELDAKRQSEIMQARQLADMEERYRQQATQAREWELDRWLEKPEVSQLVGRYDKLNGRGSFKNIVAEYGVMHHATYGEDPSVETAVSAVLQRLGAAYKEPQAPTATTQNNQEAKLPVIPNVTGKNVSPTRKSVRSIDDIRKIASESMAQS